MEQLGPYKMLERLGAGGMAEVFKGRVHGAEGFSRECVLKILHPRLASDPSFGRMLIEEARLTAYLRHPNIVAVQDLLKNGDQVVVVMEYVEGCDLHAFISSMVKRNLPMPQDVAAYIAREASAGLHYAHTRVDEEGKHLQLVHRDVSPHNILISHQGEVKIIDFGVAKIQDELREKTRAGIIKGKFGYMSPEQAWDKPLDGRSDVFAIGICLYEMLTGSSVYGQLEDPVAMIRRVRAAEIAPPSSIRQDLDPRLEHILLRALAPDRDQRYLTALDLQKDLTAFLAAKAPMLTPHDVGKFIVDIAEDRDTTVRRRLRDSDDEEDELPELTNPQVPAHEATQPMIEADKSRSQRPDVLAEELSDDEDFQMEATRVFREEREAPQRSLASPSPERPPLALRSDGSAFAQPTGVRPGLHRDTSPQKERADKTSPFVMITAALIALIAVVLIIASLI